MSIIIFSDLDGTLLDFESYSSDAAMQALNRIWELNIPLVFCTSKTRAETEVFRQAMKNTHPFIVENGAALYIPCGYFPFSTPEAERHGPYDRISLGTPIWSVSEALDKLGVLTGLRLKGMSDMTVVEVISLTGLDREAASRAKHREYTEPFIIAHGKTPDLETMEAAALDLEMSVTRGGRFWHLYQGGDKGRAVSLLTSLYRRVSTGLTTVGLGDSLNDFPMLREVDVAVLVRKASGVFEEGLGRRDVIFADEPGPAGWNNAVLELINRHYPDKKER